MKPAPAGIITMFGALRDWPRLRAFFLALLLATQVGLLVHQSQHHLNPAALGDDCTLCQFASGMAAAPSAPALPVPVFVLLAIVALPVYTAPRDVRIALSFRSRAPPVLSA